MHTRHRFLIALLILLATTIGLWFFVNKPTITKLEVGDEEFVVEIVDTPESRAQGLSDRGSLATSTGMLFVFEEPGIYTFWMKDMHFPIDIAWIDGDWCVVNMAYNVSPDSYPNTFIPSQEAVFVLEVNAGVLASKNVDTSYCFRPPLI